MLGDARAEGPAEFIEQLKKFVTILSVARSNMAGM